MEKTTIKDVANRAKVSTATVSRVLNGNYPVSEEVASRVMKVIKEMNYHPDAVARSLKNKKTFIVGVVVSDISNIYFMEMAKGIENIISSEEYNIIFSSTNDEEDKEEKILKLLYERRVDALVVAPAANDSAFINSLIDQGMYIIIVDRKISGIKTDVVIEDNFNSVYKLINYVISKGHSRISIINGLFSISTSLERFEGFKKALSDSNIELNPKYILQGNYNKKKAYEEVKKMLIECKEEKPTAIFAANNIMAEGAMAAIKDCNLDIPQDISLVSFGNVSVPELISPTLTLVSQDAYAMGQEVGRILLNRIKDKNREKIYKEHIMIPKIEIGKSVKEIKV